jgi:hypothetical protein
MLRYPWEKAHPPSSSGPPSRNPISRGVVDVNLSLSRIASTNLISPFPRERNAPAKKQTRMARLRGCSCQQQAKKSMPCIRGACRGKAQDRDGVFVKTLYGGMVYNSWELIACPSSIQHLAAFGWLSNRARTAYGSLKCPCFSIWGIYRLWWVIINFQRWDPIFGSSTPFTGSRFNIRCA